MLKTLLCVTCVVAGISSAALASECTGIDSELDRLACYDKEAGRTPKQKRIPSSPSSGNWQVSTETSAMTDRTNVYAHVDSDEPVNCGWNRGAKIRLIARCMDNTTSLVFQTGCHMTSSEYTDYGDIQYRLDDDNARTVSTQESTNNRALGLWNGARSIPFIKQMFGKSKLVVRMTPYGENPFTASFNITGLENAVTRLRASCGW